jgi:hypothetical protein
MDPVTTVAALASLSTIVKNVRDMIAHGRTINKQDAMTGSDKAGADASKDAEAVNGLANVSEDIKRALDERIERSRRKIIDRIDDPHATTDSVERIIEECEKDICWTLGRIKRFNGAKWPAKRYEQLWIEHGCEA